MSFALKFNKLKKDPKLFFKDMFYKKSVVIKNKLKKLVPKKYNGYAKYAIISAVYNVEKYLDEFLLSIVNQKLDFENNIYLICVDDGSSDSSASIIKKYQAKFPNNIIYIHKENGGQGSARNLGLEFLKNSGIQANWVTFCDPDDFLDRNYFYVVDNFLKNSSSNISMVSCNLILYYENKKAFKNNHPLSFKYSNGIQIFKNKNLDNYIQLATNSSFYRINLITNEAFPTDIKNFEDAYFLNTYLLNNLELESVFLPKAVYYYRKRADGSSTLDQSYKYEKLQVIKNLKILSLLDFAKQKCGFIPKFIQNVLIYDLHWLINSSLTKRKFISLNREELEEIIASLKKIFSFIDDEVIENFNIGVFSELHSSGILGFFKHGYPKKQKVFIKDFDRAKNQLLISYFTPDYKDILESQGKIKYQKITQYSFLGKAFAFEKHIWLEIPKDLKILKIDINDLNADIVFNAKNFKSLLLDKVYSFYPKADINIWLLVDKDIEADDNAEHLYRFILKNHPNINAYFALRKNSIHWDKLKKEGFNLVEWGSVKFKKIYKKAGVICSSHTDICLTEYFGKNSLLGKTSVFLQHGVIKDNMGFWFNTRKMDLFITSTQAEFHSLADDFTHYKFGKKEVLLSGLARHDALLKNNKINSKNVVIMPTWRAYLTGAMIAGSGARQYNKDFLKSQYFNVYKTFLHSKKLKELSDKYGYTFIFNPHPNIMPYLSDFAPPSYIKIADRKKSIQELFTNSDLMITDFSSVAFEMAYLDKPVIYYQFDEVKFRNSQYQKGYFDYRKDGFGPVVSTEDELFIELENLLKNACIVGEPYISNIKNTFKYKDGKCCERIYNAIVEAISPDDK